MIQSCNLSFSIINLSGKTWETARNDFFPLGKQKKKCCFSQVLHEMIVFSRADQHV